MKSMIFSAAVLAVACMTCNASADETGKKRGEGQRARAGQGQDAKRGPGQGRRQGGPGARGGERDPAQLVARMMQEFDKDGDRKLDSTELTALLKSMRERRGSAAEGRRGPGRPGQAQRGEGRGKQGEGRQRAGKQDAGGRRRGGAEANGNPGGERPKRPDNE